MHVLLFLLPRGPTQWPSVSWVAFAFGVAPSCGCTVLLVGLGRQPTRRTNRMQCHHLAAKQRQHLDCKRAPRQHPRAEPQCAPGSAQLERVRTLEAARGRKHDAQPPGAFSLPPKPRRARAPCRVHQFGCGVVVVCAFRRRSVRRSLRSRAVSFCFCVPTSLGAWRGIISELLRRRIATGGLRRGGAVSCGVALAMSAFQACVLFRRGALFAIEASGGCHN